MILLFVAKADKKPSHDKNDPNSVLLHTFNFGGAEDLSFWLLLTHAGTYPVVQLSTFFSFFSPNFFHCGSLS